MLTAREYEVLDGLILGDGHAERFPSGSVRYCHTSEYKSTLLELAKDLPSLSFSPPGPAGTCWQSKSKTHEDLKAVWQRWYGSGKNLVPEDLILAPETLYQWIIGDGSRGRYADSMQINVDSYSDRCIAILAREFDRIDLKIRVTPEKRIIILPESMTAMYAFIGPCRDESYKYKFEWNPASGAVGRDVRRGKLRRAGYRMRKA